MATSPVSQWLLLYAAVAIAFEQFFIRAGGTHCHSEALFMVSQCSSANSIAIYVPALYVCQMAPARLQLHAFARPFAAGFFFCLHMLPYLLQGAVQGWWAYAPSEGGEGLPLRGGPMWLVGVGSASSIEPSQAAASVLATRCARVCAPFSCAHATSFSSSAPLTSVISSSSLLPASLTLATLLARLACPLAASLACR